MPFLRRTVRSRTCVAAAKAAAAAKARLSPTKAKTAKKQTPVVSPRSVINEAAKSSSSQKDQGGAKDKAAASEGARDSSSQKDQSVSKARAAASEEAKGPSNQKDHGVAKAKVASVATARVSGQGGGEGKAASEEAKQGGAVTRLRKSVRNSDGASTSTARTISPTRSDDESVDDPDCVEAKRPRLSVCSPPDLKKRSGTTAAGVEKTSEEHEMRGQGRLRQLQRFRGTGRLDTGDGEGAGGGSWNTAGSEAREPQASSTAPPAGSEGKHMKLDKSFDPFDPSLRQPVPGKLQRFRGTERLGAVDESNAGGGIGNIGGTAAQQLQEPLTTTPTGSEQQCVKVDQSFYPPKAVRQPVLKEKGTAYKCSVSQCPLSTRECAVGLWLFALPCKKTYAKLRADWEASIKIDPKINHPLSPRVCFRHFAKTDFVSRKQRLLGLEEYAVPTIQVPGEAKKPCSYTTIFRQSSSQPSQSVSPKGASDSSAAKAGKDAAVASPCSTVNSASGSTARSSRSRGPQPDASTQPESKPERKSDPDTATSSVLSPDASSTSPVRSVPASTRGSRSTRSTAKSSIATASKREDRTAVARQTLPSAEVAPPEAELASVDGSMQQSSAKGSQSTRLPPKSSIATTSKSEKRTTAARPTPPSAVVAPPEVESASNDGSMPALTRGSQNAKPPQKSSIATASKSEKRTTAASQTPPIAEVAPIEVESDSDDGSVPASAKGSQSTRPPPESSITTASENIKTSVVAGQTPLSAKVVPSKAASTSAVRSAPASTKGTGSAKPPPKSSVATGSEKENTTVVASQTPAIAKVAPLKADYASDNGSVPASTKGSLSAKPRPKSSVATASEKENTSVAAGQKPLSAEVMPSNTASTSAVRSVAASAKSSQRAKPPPKSSVTTASANENTSVAAGQTPLSAEVVPSKAVSTFAKPPLKSSVTTASENKNISVATGQTPPSAEVVPSKAASTSAVRSVPASTKDSQSAKPAPKSSVTTASSNKNTSVAAGQTPPSAEVVPSKAALTSAVRSVPASTKDSQSAKPAPKSSVTTASSNKNTSVAAGQTPPSAEVVPSKAALTSAVRSVPASTKDSQSAKPAPKSSVTTASEKENTSVAAGQTPPSAEVVPSNTASTAAVRSVPASTKDSQSAKPASKSSVTTASSNKNTSVAAGQSPLSAEVVPSKIASTSAVPSMPASTKGSLSANPPPKSSVTTASEKENTSVVADQTPLSAEVVPSKAASTSAKPPPKSSVTTASENKNTSVAAGQTPPSAEVVPSKAASTSAVRSVPASTKDSQSAKPAPKSSVTTASSNKNTSVAAGQSPLSAEVVPSKIASTSAVPSMPASTKDSQSAKPAPKSSVTTASSNKNTSVAAGQSPLSAEVVPSKIASTSAVPSMPASTKGSLSAKPPPKSSVTTASEKENTSVAAGQTPPSAEVVPSNALSTSAVRTVPASTKVSQSAKPPPKSSVAAESKTENTTVLAGETPGSADVAPQEAESASNIGSAPALPKGSTSTKLQPESSIATVSEMDNSTVTPDKTLSSARVMPLEAALDSDISSMPASAKHSPSTKPQPEPIVAVASGTGNSCLAIGQTPLSTEVSFSKVVSTSDVGSVPASVKCSPSSGAKPIIATVSDTDNGTVVTGKILLNTELVSSKAVLASGHGSVTASAKCSPHTKQQPDPSFAIASETGNSIAVTGEKLRITEVVPPEGASASDIRPVPASTKGSPSTKLQPESSIGTASQTGDSTVEAVRTPPCTEVVPQLSASSALESTPTIHADLGSAAKDCLASTVLNAGSKATAAPMSSSGVGSIPVPESKSTAATVSSSPAAGDAAVPAADAISMPAEEAMSDLTSEMESAHDTLPDSTATGDSSTVVESAEPAAADELTAVTRNSGKLEAASTSGASVVLTEDSSKTVEDSESTVCAGLAERDSLAPEGRATSKAAPSESSEQTDSCVQLQPRPERRRRSSSSASDATESAEDCYSPRAQLSPSGCKPAKRRCRKSLKRAGDEEVASIGISPPLPLGAVSSMARETVSTVGAKSLPEAGSTPAVVYKSEPDTDFSCSTAAVALENLEPHPSPATTLSYSSDTDLEESVTPEVFSGRVFDPSDGSYVIEREIVGERDDFGMSAVFYRVSWAPR
ncbi:uncharacterized protein LOC144138585 isoform X2 [Haemaphysalis longicornis]